MLYKLKKSKMISPNSFKHIKNKVIVSFKFILKIIIIFKINF